MFPRKERDQKDDLIILSQILQKPFEGVLVESIDKTRKLTISPYCVWDRICGALVRP